MVEKLLGLANDDIYPKKAKRFYDLVCGDIGGANGDTNASTATNKSKAGIISSKAKNRH